MKNRPKFLRHYSSEVQLRVEQIGPDLWGGAMCDGRWVVDSALQSPRWHVFTELSEKIAKRSAMAMAFNIIGPAFIDSDKDWRCLSNMPDEEWFKSMNALGFTEYVGHEGIERWDGF